MGKVICVVNQKGGVGKTTTVINLAASLASLGRKTLIIDLDPQGNATSGIGLDKRSITKTIYDSIIADMDIRETITDIYPSRLRSCLRVSPANPDLTGAELELAELPSREWRLRESLEPVRADYDYVFIDCPPSLGLLTVNALTAADSVLITVQCEYYAMEGLSQLQTTLNLIKERLNPGLEVEGYLLTMFDPRNKLAHVVVSEVKNYFGAEVFATIIPRNIRLAECPSHGLPSILYDESSAGAMSYKALAEELLGRNGGAGH